MSSWTYGLAARYNLRDILLHLVGASLSLNWLWVAFHNQESSPMFPVFESGPCQSIISLIIWTHVTHFSMWKTWSDCPRQDHIQRRQRNKGKRQEAVWCCSQPSSCLMLQILRICSQYSSIHFSTFSVAKVWTLNAFIVNLLKGRPHFKH